MEPGFLIQWAKFGRLGLPGVTKKFQQNPPSERNYNETYRLSLPWPSDAMAPASRPFVGDGCVCRAIKSGDFLGGNQQLFMGCLIKNPVFLK